MAMEGVLRACVQAARPVLDHPAGVVPEIHLVFRDEAKADAQGVRGNQAVHGMASRRWLVRHRFGQQIKNSIRPDALQWPPF